MWHSLNLVTKPSSMTSEDFRSFLGPDHLHPQLTRQCDLSQL